MPPCLRHALRGFLLGLLPFPLYLLWSAVEMGYGDLQLLWITYRSGGDVTIFIVPYIDVTGPCGQPINPLLFIAAIMLCTGFIGAAVGVLLARIKVTRAPRSLAAENYPISSPAPPPPPTR